MRAGASRCGPVILPEHAAGLQPANALRRQRSMIQPPLPGGSGSGRAGRPAIPARTRRGTAAPGSRPSVADGEHRLRQGDAAAYPGPAFPGPPGWRRRGLVPGGHAEADGGGARTPVLVRFVLAYPLNRPRHAYLAVSRNKPVQHGSRPRIGRQLSTLVALAVGEEDQPWLEAAQHHQAGRGNGVAGCTRDGHGFRHRLHSPAGCVQPRGELTQRVGVQVCDIHPPSLAPPRTVSDIGYGPDRDAARADALIFVFRVPSGRPWHAGSASWLVGWWGWRLRCSDGCSRDAVDRRRDPRRGETPRRMEQRTRWTT